MGLLEDIQKEAMKEKLPEFKIGDVVDVHVKIREGEKERIQVFSGTVIARRGSGMSETFTVRRIVAGEGVERVFPIHSPTVVDVKVTRHGHVRRAKLYYLRGRKGKASRVKERRREKAETIDEIEEVETTDAAETAEAPEDTDTEQT